MFTFREINDVNPLLFQILQRQIGLPASDPEGKQEDKRQGKHIGC